MNPAAFMCLSCLLFLCAQGQPANRSNNCKCLNGYIGRVNPRLIRGEPVIHQPSVFCPNIEIIVTTKTGQQSCVNPQSPFGQLILKNDKRQRKKEAVTIATASSQRTTSNSRGLHTTSQPQGSTAIMTTL